MMFFSRWNYWTLFFVNFLFLLFKQFVFRTFLAFSLQILFLSPVLTTFQKTTICENSKMSNNFKLNFCVNIDISVFSKMLRDTHSLFSQHFFYTCMFSFFFFLICAVYTFKVSWKCWKNKIRTKTKSLFGRLHCVCVCSIFVSSSIYDPHNKGEFCCSPSHGKEPFFLNNSRKKKELSPRKVSTLEKKIVAESKHSKFVVYKLWGYPWEKLF